MSILPDKIGKTVTSLECGGVVVRKLAVQRYRHGRWTSTSHASSFTEPLATSFKVLCWNVDCVYAEPYEQHWARSFVKELKRRLEPLRPLSSEPGASEERRHMPAPCCVVLLQGVQRETEKLLFSDEWIRQNMLAVPASPSISESQGSLSVPLGATIHNITLISRTIPVSQAFHISFFNSQTARHAVVVDLKFYAPRDSQKLRTSPITRVREVRIINVQLESFERGAEARKDQVRFLLHEIGKDPALHGVLLGVDVKDIPPSDTVVSPSQEERTSRVIVQEPASMKSSGNDLTSKSIVVLRNRLGQGRVAMEGVRVGKSRSGIAGDVQLM